MDSRLIPVAATVVNRNINSEANGEDLKSHGICQSLTLASGLQKCLATAWQTEDPFSDFDVIVEGVTYRCHKHLLNVTSGYFQAVFRSGMKESLENRLELKLMSREVFEVIITALYTGMYGLTKDNIQDIWPATQLLQIQHLCDECENFALQDVTEGNCVEMYHFAKSIFSTKVANCAKNCMLFGFEAMIQSEGFLQLMTPDVFSDLLENQLLSVFNENVVVESILRWTYYQPELTQNEDQSRGGGLSDSSKETSIIKIKNFTPASDEGQGFCATKPNVAAPFDEHNLPVPNERFKHLPKLLRSAKTLLVSVDCLNGLIRQNIASESPECLEIIQEAVEFLGKHDVNHCAWKKSATHRFSSGQEHAVVIMTSDGLTVYRMESPHHVSHVPWIPHTLGTTYENMIVFKNKVYLEERSTFYNSLLTLDEDRNWCHVMVDNISYEFDIKSNKSSKLFSHQGSMYRFHVGVLYRICEAASDISEPLWVEVFRSESIEAATEIVSFDSFILFFSNTGENAIVYGLDIETGLCRRMPDFDGRACHLNIINDGNSSYSLQSCGALKRLLKTEDEISFQFVAQLWDCEWMPMLAVTYLDKLVIFGKDMLVPLEVKTVTKALTGFFDSIEIVKLNEGYHCFPMIVPRQWFR